MVVVIYAVGHALTIVSNVKNWYAWNALSMATRNIEDVKSAQSNLENSIIVSFT